MKDPVVAEEFRAFGETFLAGAPAPDGETLYDDRHPLWEKFTAAGLANWWLPAGYGGRGVSLTDSVSLVAGLAYHDAGFAFTSFLPVLASRMLELYGEDSLRRELLAGMASAGSFCAALGSEAAAGSELANTRTTFRRTSGHLVINGAKQFSTNLGPAAFCLVLARNEEEHRDFAVIVVPAGTEGFTVGHRWRMSGLLGTGTWAATFTDCAVPEANELRGNGIRVLEVGLNASRILMAALAIGIARRVRDLSMEYADGKRVGGQELWRNAVFAARLGQAEAELECLKSVCDRAAADYDALYHGPDPAGALYGLGVLKSAVVAKMICGQLGWGIVSRASESFGGLGYTEAHPVQRLMRDMRHIAIVEGGDDVLRELVFGRWVKRPSRRG